MREVLEAKGHEPDTRRDGHHRPSIAGGHAGYQHEALRTERRLFPALERGRSLGLVAEQRRDVRYPARIVARIVRRGETVELLTNDVSFRGAFLRTDAPPSIRQLVRITLALPEGAEVTAHAMVVHVVEKGGGAERVPGAGVQFWGPISDAKAWDTFVHALKAKEKAGLPSARATDKVRRSSERFKLQIDVILDGKSAKTRDLSYTGLAVATELGMPLGARARLQLLANGNEPLFVDVVVRRKIEEPRFKGLGLEYVDVNEEQRRAIVAFVRANAPKEDAVFVSPEEAAKGR